MNELTLSTATPGMTVTATLMQGTTVTASGIAMTETSVPGDYVGSVPSNTAAGRYRVLALSDGVIVGSGELVWAGTAEDFDPPAPPSELGLCRVYGYIEGPDNLKLANVAVTFDLQPSAVAVASERLIGGRRVITKTDAEGRIVGPGNVPYLDLQRTDLLAADGGVDVFYEVTSPALGVHRKRVELTAATADLRTLLITPAP